MEEAKQKEQQRTAQVPVEELIYWIWLAERLGPGSRKAIPLLRVFGSPREIWNADEEALRSAELPASLEDRRMERLLDKDLRRESEILATCERSGYTLLPLADGRYPMSLRDLSAPPILLYTAGEIPDFAHRLCIGVVGTRRMSEYGKQTAYKIAYELAYAGAIVVSGMALGIDSVAGAAALASRGTTVAVLGCGLDVVYPPEHGRLYEVIRKLGFAVSEYPPGTPPVGRHFPERNRIISGLSAGVLVVEASSQSGSIITATLASEEGRDVFAVPGNIGAPGADGTNALLQKGAHMTLSAEDILGHYRDLYRQTLRGADETALGTRSDCDSRVLVRLGIYGRCEGGFSRIPAGAPVPTEAVLTPPERHKTAVSAVEKQPEQDGGAEMKRSGQKKKAEMPETPAPGAEGVRPIADKGNSGTDRNNVRLSQLNEEGRRVFEAIPLDRSVTMDELTELGLTTSALLVALSLLEINGLIHTLPGGKYARS